MNNQPRTQKPEHPRDNRCSTPNTPLHVSVFSGGAIPKKSWPYIPWMLKLTCAHHTALHEKTSMTAKTQKISSALADGITH